MPDNIETELLQFQHDVFIDNSRTVTKTMMNLRQSFCQPIPIYPEADAHVPPHSENTGRTTDRCLGRLPSNQNSGQEQISVDATEIGKNVSRWSALPPLKRQLEVSRTSRRPSSPPRLRRESVHQQRYHVQPGDIPGDDQHVRELRVDKA